MRTAFEAARSASPELIRLHEQLTEEILSRGINGRRVVGRISPDLVPNIIRAIQPEVGERGSNKFRINNNHARFLQDGLRIRRTDLAPRLSKPRRRPSDKQSPTYLPPLGPNHYNEEDGQE